VTAPPDRPPPLSAPHPLSPSDDLDTFQSGVEPLDEWLKRRARRNEADGASRTFVVCEGRRVVGYYSLAAGSVLAGAATGRVRRNMPNPVPVVLLGRLAIDAAWQGRGLGADLLRDAVRRTLHAGANIGVRAMLVHAISESAARFYQKHGFRPSPVEPATLMITAAEADTFLSGNQPADHRLPLQRRRPPATLAGLRQRRYKNRSIKNPPTTLAATALVTSVNRRSMNSRTGSP
jgi:GNAT superfamily N-acetyltransferase